MDTMNKPTENGCNTTCCPCPSKHCRVSMSAIVSGALAAMGLGFLANLLSLGAGFSTYAALDSPTAIMTVTFLWIVCSVFIAMFIAGLITGCSARHCCTTCCSGMKHGFLAWCLGLVGMIFLTTQLNLVLPVNIQQVTAGAHPTTIMMDKEPTMAVKVVAPKGNTKEPTVTTKTVNTEKAAVAGAIVSMQAFFVFLIAAFAMMLGAHIGSRCDK